VLCCVCVCPFTCAALATKSPPSKAYSSNLACFCVLLLLCPVLLQFFNTLFWQCSIGVCVDRSVDDVGFVETVMKDLPNRFAVNRGQVRLCMPVSGGTWGRMWCKGAGGEARCTMTLMTYIMRDLTSRFAVNRGQVRGGRFIRGTTRSGQRAIVG
jgi:hypothetical protein